MHSGPGDLKLWLAATCASATGSVCCEHVVKSGLYLRAEVRIYPLIWGYIQDFPRNRTLMLPPHAETYGRLPSDSIRAELPGGVTQLRLLADGTVDERAVSHWATDR